MMQPRPTDMFANIFGDLQGRPGLSDVAQALFAMGDVMAPPGQQTGAAQQFVMDSGPGDLNTRIRLAQLAQGPSRIRELDALQQAYDVSRDQALRMVYPTGSTYGVTPVMQGGVMFDKYVTPGGQTGYTPIMPDLQTMREETLTAEERARGYGTAAGTEQVAQIKSLQEGMSNAGQMLSDTVGMLNRFEAGEFDQVTGPIRGYITKFYRPEAQIVAAYATRNQLNELDAVNLAPVSNYEIQLLENLNAGLYKTKGQNIAVLREIRKAQELRAAKLNEMFDQYRQGKSWEDVLFESGEIQFTPRKDLLDVGGEQQDEEQVPPGWERDANGIIRRVR